MDGWMDGCEGYSINWLFQPSKQHLEAHESMIDDTTPPEEQQKKRLEQAHDKTHLLGGGSKRSPLQRST